MGKLLQCIGKRQEKRVKKKLYDPLIHYIKNRREKRKPLADNEFYASELAGKCGRRIYLERKEDKDFNTDNGYLRMYLGEIIHQGIQKAFKKEEIEISKSYEEAGIKIFCRVDIFKDGEIIELKSVSGILDKPKFGAAAQAEIYLRAFDKRKVEIIYLNLTATPFQHFTHYKADGLKNWLIKRAVKLKEHLETNTLPPSCGKGWCKACKNE